MLCQTSFKVTLFCYKRLGAVLVITKLNPRSREGARCVFRIFQSLWNLTGVSAAQLTRRLPNSKVMLTFKPTILRLRGFYEIFASEVLPDVETIYFHLFGCLDTDCVEASLSSRHRKKTWDKLAPCETTFSDRTKFWILILEINVLIDFTSFPICFST